MNADELTAALFDDADEDENSFSIRQIKKETGFLDDDDDTNLTAPGKEFCEILNCLYYSCISQVFFCLLIAVKKTS